MELLMSITKTPTSLSPFTSNQGNGQHGDVSPTILSRTLSTYELIIKNYKVYPTLPITGFGNDLPSTIFFFISPIHFVWLGQMVTDNQSLAYV